MGWAGLGGCAGQVVTTNVAKVPRLADIVLPDLAITGTATETFAVKVVGYATGLALVGPALWAASGAVRVHVSIEIPAVAHSRARHDRRGHPVRRPPQGGRTTPARLLPLTFDLRLARLHGHGRGHGVVERPRGRRPVSRPPTGPWPRSPRRSCWAQAYRKQPWEGLDRLATRFALP